MSTVTAPHPTLPASEVRSLIVGAAFLNDITTHSWVEPGLTADQCADVLEDAFPLSTDDVDLIVGHVIDPSLARSWAKILGKLNSPRAVVPDITYRPGLMLLGCYLGMALERNTKASLAVKASIRPTEVLFWFLRRPLSDDATDALVQVIMSGIKYPASVHAAWCRMLRALIDETHFEMMHTADTPAATPDDQTLVIV